MDFLDPSTHAGSRGPLVRQDSTPDFVPPSGFGYPLDGFLPQEPGEPYFMLTASLGFAPSEHSRAQKASSMFPCRLTHVAFHSRLMRRTSSSHGNARRAFWAFILPSKPGDRTRGKRALTQLLPWGFPF
jgi:hypothetical protein